MTKSYFQIQLYENAIRPIPRFFRLIICKKFWRNFGIIFILFSLISSCSSIWQRHKKITSSEDQKIVLATQNFADSLRQISCKNHQGNSVAKEKNQRLISLFKPNDLRINRAKSFLTTLNQIERSPNITACQSLVKKLRDDVDNFAKSLGTSKNSTQKTIPNVSEKSRKRFQGYEAI